MKRVGILTGGGDAPGLNAVIRGVVVRLAKQKNASYQCIGFIDGWAGLRDNRTVASCPSLTFFGLPDPKAFLQKVEVQP